VFSSPEVYRVGDLRVDVEGASVSRDGERIALPPRTMELFVALVRRHPSLVRRNDLLEAVWQDETVTDQTLSHRVMVLRKALGDHAERPLYVAGERGYGYRLVAPVVRVAPEGRGPGGEAAPRWQRRTRALALALVGAAGLAIAIASTDRARHPPALPPATLTVAVRPFTTHAGVSASDPVAAELALALSSGLRGVSGVRVVRGGDDSAETSHLRIEGVWEGADETMSLRLRLVEAAGGARLWSEEFRGSRYELLGREDAIASAVRAAVRERAGPGPAPATAPVSPRVRRLCLRGELFWLSFTEDGLRRSAEAWETAAVLAPDHAPAHAGWALAEAARGLLGYRPPAEAEARARAESRRALQLAPALPASRLAGSLVKLLFDWDAVAATAEARTALEADPDDLRAPIVLGLALQARGRFEESLRLLDDAPIDDPHSTAALFLAGRAYEMDGRWASGAAAYARALVLEPGLAPARRGRAECLAAGRRETEALVALGNGSAREDASPTDTLREAWRRLCRSEDGSGEGLRACLLGGETERAARELATAVDARRPFVVFVPQDAILEPLRERAAFRAILERLEPASRSAG
jgi:DNA-binding winged helix-turn-helix (wHTH) protein/tetratricopeptide (TPR) repeat protein